MNEVLSRLALASLNAAYAVLYSSLCNKARLVY
nr:MAG TPA: hypothetical protein [Caudoviricetes sp.]